MGATTQMQKPSVLKFMLSLSIAAIADGLNVADFSFPWLYIPVDIGTALVLLAIFGLRREIFLALVTEVIPGLNLFPTWVAVVVYLYWGSKHEEQPSEQHGKVDRLSE